MGKQAPTSQTDGLKGLWKDKEMERDSFKSKNTQIKHMPHDDVLHKIISMKTRATFETQKYPRRPRDQRSVYIPK